MHCKVKSQTKIWVWSWPKYLVHVRDTLSCYSSHLQTIEMSPCKKGYWRIWYQKQRRQIVIVSCRTDQQAMVNIFTKLFQNPWLHDKLWHEIADGQTYWRCTNVLTYKQNSGNLQSSTGNFYLNCVLLPDYILFMIFFAISLLLCCIVV